MGLQGGSLRGCSTRPLHFFLSSNTGLEVRVGQTLSCMTGMLFYVVSLIFATPELGKESGRRKLFLVNESGLLF